MSTASDSANGQALEAVAVAGHEEGGGHVLLPYRVYVQVWVGLVSLTLLTVAAHYAELRHVSLLVALAIACAKSTLVLLWFMHVKFENRVVWWFMIAGVGTYVIFILLTFADYSYR
jgi:cytochrome c oxidase subunit 4